MSKVALTQGQWSVIDKEIWLDEANGFVYFHGLRETPLEKHLYVVSIDQPCNVRRLTTSGYSHTAYLNEVKDIKFDRTDVNVPWIPPYFYGIQL